MGKELLVTRYARCRNPMLRSYIQSVLEQASVTMYHATTPESASSILEEGFYGEWGDVGYGVYFYDNLGEAMAYGGRGGWTGDLDGQDFVVLAVSASASDFEKVQPDPSWPNPEDYSGVWFHEMDDEDDLRWKPEIKIVS